MARSGGAGGRTEAVLTCPGDNDDPGFHKQVKTVKITFDLPPEAAEKLSALAQSGDDVLREMGILSLQTQGGQIISMTVMSEEELRQRKSSKTAHSSSSVKLEQSDTNTASIPSTSSLLVNLLQNKDNLSLETSKTLQLQSAESASKASADHVTTTKKSVLQSGSSSGLHLHHHHRLQSKVKLEESSGAMSSIKENNTDERSQNTQQKSLMPPPSSPLTSGASGTIPTLSGDGLHASKNRQQILINPNTGVLESGPPSNSLLPSSLQLDSSHHNDSPDNHHHHHHPHPDLEAAARIAKSEKALKLKLKLPNPPINPVKSPSGSSNSSASSVDKNSESSATSPSSGPTSGPKLPKLILSMKDKTVKTVNNKKRSHAEMSSSSADPASCNDSSADLHDFKAKSPKRTLESDVRSEISTGASLTISKSSSSSNNQSVQNNASTKMQKQQQQVNHCVQSKSLSSNQESTNLNDGSSSTKKHERLSAWAKSITSRLDKGAFNNAMNHDHEDEDDIEKGTFGLKGKDEIKREVVHVNHVRLQPNTSLIEVKKEPFVEVPMTTSMDTSTASTTIKTLSLSNGPTNNESSRSSSENNPTAVKSEVAVEQQASEAGSLSEDLEVSSKMDTSLPHLPPQGEPPDNQACNQQGEDSGIESMDTLSEKSPNQGENPYPNEERMDMVINNKSSPSSGSCNSSNSPSTSSSTDLSSSTTVQSKATIITSSPNSLNSSSNSNSSASSTASNSSSSEMITTVHQTELSSSSSKSSENSSNSSSSSAKVLKNIPTQIEVVAPPATATVVEAMDTSENSSTTPPAAVTAQQEMQRSSPSPVMLNGHNGSGPNVTVRPAHLVPPGSKMVPVKLVSVSAEGNVRLVRVSPVKSTSAPLNTSVVMTPSSLSSAEPSSVTPSAAATVAKQTVIIKSTNSVVSSNSLNAGSTITVANQASSNLPVLPATTQLVSKDSNNTKDSSTVVLVGEKSSSEKSATTTVTPTSSNATMPISLRPSLSIMPVFEPPSGQSGTLSMKDVMENINRKNLESIEPLEIDVKASTTTKIPSATTSTTAVKQPRIGPLAKRSPMQLPEHNFVGGGSLLKPLLATPTTSNQKDSSSTLSVTTTTSTTTTTVVSLSTASAAAAAGESNNSSTSNLPTVISTVSNVTSNHVDGGMENEKKRRRRDTDSSTKSDKSDISLISVESSNSVTTTTAKKKSSAAAAATTSAVTAAESVSKKPTTAKARKGANAVKVTKKEEDKIEVNSTTVKKPTRVENARNKAKPATVGSTTTSSTTTVINLDQEISRRSIRQSTPTPPVVASRPPSGRQQTPTRQTNPQTASTTAQTPKLNKKANNSQLKKNAVATATTNSVAEEKSKRNSGSNNPTSNNSGSSSIVQTLASSTASAAVSQVTGEVTATTKKGMKTRSAKSTAAASAGRS